MTVNYGVGKTKRNLLGSNSQISRDEILHILHKGLTISNCKERCSKVILAKKKC